MRKEKDSMGEVSVPDDSYYGAQTQRAKENFNISGKPIPTPIIKALGYIKKSAAIINNQLYKDRITDAIRDSILKASDEIIDGKLKSQFIVDVFQTGSGTSSNMNINEVIANRANEIMGSEIGSKSPVHPNDHVNFGQSSNDVFPTSISVAVAMETRENLLPALNELKKNLDSLSHKSILKKFENKKDIEFNNQIEFQKVSFFYTQENDNKMIFDNLNIKIEKNQCIGIIGPSGSGKSTLLEIFCGLLETSSGSIYYDGKELNQAQARFSTSYVSQDTRILNTTLKKNITLNFKNVDREFNEAKYKNAIEKSNVSNFINQLNNKDDTLLGDLGSSISGGQRQRIGIARAIYHDAEILILDEFTNSLDEKTEKSILHDIKLLKKFKTIIMSTHKKDILTICDRVYKIDQKNLKTL